MSFPASKLIGKRHCGNKHQRKVNSSLSKWNVLFFIGAGTQVFAQISVLNTVAPRPPMTVQGYKLGPNLLNRCCPR